MNPGRQGDPVSCQYVAIPTDGGTIWPRPHGGCIRLPGRARSSVAKIVPNPDPGHVDPSHHRVMLDVVRGCQVVSAVHIGPPMIASLTHLGVEVLGAPTESVDAALRAYQRSLAGGPPLEVLRVDPGTMHTHHHDEHRVIQP